MKRIIASFTLIIGLFITTQIFAERDLEAGVFLSRDPAGFVDGPNVYTYVKQNPWTWWDPLGLYLPENADNLSGSKSWADSTGYIHVTAGSPNSVHTTNTQVTNDHIAVAHEFNLNTGPNSSPVNQHMAAQKLHAIIPSNSPNAAAVMQRSFRDAANPGTVTMDLALPAGIDNGYGPRAPFAPGKGNIPAPTLSQKKIQENNVTLYRGVHGNHPDLPNARNGEANPMGGHSDPKLHNEGDVQSEFTSWTVHKDFAEVRADAFKHAGKPGVVLEKTVPQSKVTKSPDQFQEGERLMKGKVTGAKVEERK